IVGDFHSQVEAQKAADDFAREVQQGAEPSDIAEILLSSAMKLPQALVTAGLAPSRTEAERLIKAGAVELGGERCSNLGLVLPQGTHTVRAGKKWKRITVPA